MVEKHRENMILFNVLNKEVVFEEYFCNLLRLDNFRSMFIDFISKNNNILKDLTINYEDFNTEIILNKNDKNYGRADLFLEVDNKEFIFEIKNKWWTKLTDKQPSEYLEYLDYKNQHLFFLIPIGYRHKGEIFEQWKNFAGIKNQIFYWEDLVEEIRKYNLQEQNIEIEMFYDFCEYWFNMNPIKFTDEEQNLFKTKGNRLNTFKNLSVPRLIKKLKKVVRNVGDNANMTEDNSDLGFFYSCIEGNYKIWFGIDYDYWEANEIPLSLLIQNHANGYEDFELELNDIRLDKFKNKVTNTAEEYFGYYVENLADLGSENYQNSIIKTIEQIKRKIQKQT